MYRFYPAKREDNSTQTDSVSPSILRPTDSIYTVNEEDETLSLQHYDVANQTSGILKIKSTRSQSVPVLTRVIRRMESVPLMATVLPSSDRPSTSSLCKTVEGVPLAAEKVVVFSYDSFVVGGLSARSSVSAQLQQLVDEPVEDDSTSEKEDDESVHIYKQMPSLRSTDL